MHMYARPAGLSPVGFQLTPAFLRKRDIKMENFHTDIILRNQAAPMFFLKSQHKDGEREKKNRKCTKKRNTRI